MDQQPLLDSTWSRRRPKALAALTAALAMLSISSSARAEPPTGYPFLSFDEGLREAHEQGKRIFLYFGRLGCTWCDKTNVLTFSDANIRKRYADHYVLVYVDAEGDKRLRLPTGEIITEAEVGMRFRAFATPLFVFLEPDGRVIFQVPGVQTVKDLTDFDRYVTGEHYRTQSFVEFVGN